MYDVPAICESCGKVWLSGAITLGAETAGWLADNRDVGGCPHCGGTGLIPAGWYKGASAILFRRAEIEALVAGLTALRAELASAAPEASSDPILEKVSRTYPFLKHLKRFGKTVKEVVFWVNLVLGVLNIGRTANPTTEIPIHDDVQQVIQEQCDCSPDCCAPEETQPEQPTNSPSWLLPVEDEMYPLATERDFEQRVLKRKTVHIGQLAAHGHMGLKVHAKTFDRCHIVGPAILAPTGSELQDCAQVRPTMVPRQHASDAMLWKLEERPYFMGHVWISNCQFKQCLFTNIGWLGTEETLKAVRSVLKVVGPAPTPTPITSPPTPDSPIGAGR